KESSVVRRSGSPRTASAGSRVRLVTVVFGLLASASALGLAVALGRADIFVLGLLVGGVASFGFGLAPTGIRAEIPLRLILAAGMVTAVVVTSPLTHVVDAVVRHRM